jgi:hypothetical protein
MSRRLIYFDDRIGACKPSPKMWRGLSVWTRLERAMGSSRDRTAADNPIPDGAQRKSPTRETRETPRLEPRRWAALAVLLVAGFMDLVDVTIVNVAIPSMLRDLHAAYSQIEWGIAGYIVGFAALLITGGRLGDLYGRKRIFLIGVAGFIVASGLCGLATHPATLIGHDCCRARWPG